MGYDLIISPRAEIEIENAADWYKNKQYGIEKRFLQLIALHLKGIRKNPYMYPIKHVILRECVMRPFPFLIIYSVENNNSIIVHSVFNTHQNPTKKP